MHSHPLDSDTPVSHTQLEPRKGGGVGSGGVGASGHGMARGGGGFESSAVPGLFGETSSPDSQGGGAITVFPSRSRFAGRQAGSATWVDAQSLVSNLFLTNLTLRTRFMGNGIMEVDIPMGLMEVHGSVDVPFPSITGQSMSDLTNTMAHPNMVPPIRQTVLEDHCTPSPFTQPRPNTTHLMSTESLETKILSPPFSLNSYIIVESQEAINSTTTQPRVILLTHYPASSL
jgi:hypothetical protein